MRKLRLKVLLLCMLSLLSPLGVEGSSHGVEGYSETGCTCHGENPGEDAEVTISGIPDRYDQGETYSLVVSLKGGPSEAVSGHQGGFNLAASSGTFSPLDSTTYVTEAGEITHDHSGANQRSWEVDWTAPMSEEDIVFTIAGNIVDGDHQQSDADDWALNSYTISADEFTFGERIMQSILIVFVISLFVVPVFMLWRREKNRKLREQQGSRRKSK